MSFLSPWFFLGLLAVGAPLLAHLRRLSVKNRVDFSAMHFLEPLPPRKARQRWEDVALMVARICALGLLAFAFARPYVRQSGAGVGSAANHQRQVVVLLDSSASMRRTGLFQEARDLVAQVASSLKEDDVFELFAFDRTVRSVLGSELWGQTPAEARASLLGDLLSKMEPGWAGTQLDDALQFVVDGKNGGASDALIEVVVVSDFQEGSHLAKLQGQQWPKKLQVKLLPVPAQQPRVDEAISLHWLPTDPETASVETPFKFQVHAGPGYSGSLVKLGIEGQPSRDWMAPVTAGKTRIVTVPGVPFESGFVRVAGASDFSSGVWVSRLPLKRALVALGGRGDALDRSGARYFVNRAVTALGDARVEVLGGEGTTSEKDASVALWISSGTASAEWNSRMVKAVEKGAVALLTLEDVPDAQAAGALLGEAWEVKEAQVNDFAVLGEMDRTHPLLAPFKSPQFADFSGIRFWHYRRVVLPKESSVRVLARFEGGDPALMECVLGAGRVLIWTSNWRPHDAQWVLSSRCVPFLAGCLDVATGGRAPFVVATPGESFVLPEGSTGLKGLDGTLFRKTAGRASLDVPGVYSMEPQGGVVVINVASDESRLAPLPAEKFESLGLPLLRPSADEVQLSDATKPQAAVLVAAEIEARQGGWRWLLGAVLVLLTIETWWAARLSSSSKHEAL